MASSANGDFIVWGDDHTLYGPIELPTLVSWVKDERVTADSWIFAGNTDSWQKAEQVPELQMFFRRKGKTGPVELESEVDPRALRRIKVLGEMSDEQLERFARFMSVEKIPQRSLVVKQGEPGDTMYLILEGELRVCIMLNGKETLLATLTVGDFFGDVSLFDHGPRSADVIANTDSTLLRISSSAVEELSKDAPQVANMFLRRIGQTLSARMRANNRRLADFARFA
jgi:hypothetical protein